MKTLIIPDLHAPSSACLETLEEIIERESPDETIFLGDYFDAWDDTAEDARRVGSWLCNSLLDTRRIHLLGNHDISYLWPSRATYCRGWTEEKQNAVSEFFRDGNEFEFHHWCQGWLLTHAGLAAAWVPSGISITEWLNAEARSAVAAFSSGQKHWFNAVGPERGGYERAGGLLWADWWERRYPIKQIFGHTPDRQVRMDELSYCLDTNLGRGGGPRHLGVCIDGSLTVRDLC